MYIKKTSQFGIFIFLLKKISDKSCTKIQENEEKVIEAAPEVFSYEKAYDEDNFLPKKEVYTSALHKKDNLKVKKDLTLY